jgi:hypothetical protein
MQINKLDTKPDTKVIPLAEGTIDDNTIVRVFMTPEGSFLVSCDEDYYSIKLEDIVKDVIEFRIEGQSKDN